MIKWRNYEINLGLGLDLFNQPLCFDNGIRERFGCFLRQIMPDTTGDRMMYIGAFELSRIGGGGRVGGAIGISLERDSRYDNNRGRRQFLFQFIVLRLSGGNRQAP